VLVWPEVIVEGLNAFEICAGNAAEVVLVTVRTAALLPAPAPRPVVVTPLEVFV